MQQTTPQMRCVLKKVFVNAPFIRLIGSYLPLFLSMGINPEIGLDAEALDTAVLDEYKTVARRLREHALTVTFHGPFIDLSPGSIDPNIRAVTRRRFEQVLKLIPLFRPQSVVCHAGYEQNRFGFFREEWLEKSFEMWSWLAERVTSEGSRLMLENVYEHHPADIRVLFEKLAPQQVGFCLDIGHQKAFGKAPLSDWLTELGPFIGQLHLHDNRGEKDDHIAIGHGVIDFNFLFSWLKKNRATPPLITLEPHEEKDLWPSLTYLDNMWPWEDKTKLSPEPGM
jgi:sugar phosphate isomerase/epimerase